LKTILGRDFKWQSEYHWTPLAMAPFLFYEYGFIFGVQPEFI